MIKKSLSVGIILLFLFSVVSPLVIGFEEYLETTDLLSNSENQDGLMESAWPMKSHDRRHTGQSPYSTMNNSGIEKWRYFTAGWVRGGPIVDKEGTIFFGDYNYYFYAIYPNGTLKWKIKLDGTIWSTPAISENGTIYVGTNSNRLHAINPDGTLKWSFATGDTVFSSPVIAKDNTIYFGTMGDGHHIFAINPCPTRCNKGIG